MKIINNLDDCERLESETADQGDYGGERLENDTAGQIDCERLENEAAAQIECELHRCRGHCEQRWMHTRLHNRGGCSVGKVILPLELEVPTHTLVVWSAVGADHFGLWSSSSQKLWSLGLGLDRARFAAMLLAELPFVIPDVRAAIRYAHLPLPSSPLLFLISQQL